MAHRIFIGYDPSGDARVESALKALLGMGCRVPFPEPDPEALTGLPPACEIT